MIKESTLMTSSEIKHVPKGWGYEKWIVNTEEYCGKLLFLNEGKRCSWHYHKLKDETFYLQSGKILLYYGDLMEQTILFWNQEINFISIVD